MMFRHWLLTLVLALISVYIHPMNHAQNAAHFTNTIKQPNELQ